MYFLVFIFSFYSGNAQLYISPSPAGDSYIYLSDHFLYVKDDNSDTLESTANPLRIFQRWIYKYSGSKYKCWQHTGVNFKLKPGQGYSIKGIKGSDNTVINGVVNNPGQRQPYDFKGLSNAGGEETGNFWGNGSEISREYSSVAPGFILTRKNNSYINSKNSQRRFQKKNAQTSKFKNQQRSEIPLLKLLVNFNDLYTRPLLLAFREDSSREEDWAMDAKIHGVLENDVGWNIEEALYNVQVRPFRKNDKIPLIIDLTEASKLTFRIEDFRYLLTDNIYLFDAELNTYEQLDIDDFTIDLQKGNYSKRFFISFIGEEEENPLLKYLKQHQNF